MHNAESSEEIDKSEWKKALRHQAVACLSRHLPNDAPPARRLSIGSSRNNYSKIIRRGIIDGQSLRGHKVSPDML